MFPDPVFHVRDARVVERYKQLVAASSSSPPSVSDVPLLPAGAAAVQFQMDTGFRVRVIFPTYELAARAWRALGVRDDLVKPTQETPLLIVPTSNAARYKEITRTIGTLSGAVFDSMVDLASNPLGPEMAHVPSVDQKKRDRDWDQSLSSSSSS